MRPELCFLFARKKDSLTRYPTHPKIATRVRLEEPVEQASTGGHTDTEPPPLVCLDSAGCPLVNDLVVQWELASLRVLGGGGLRDERVERGGRQSTLR